MYRTITYFNVVGYEKDGREIYEEVDWVCYDEKEFDYALCCIDDKDIIDIR